MGLFSWFTSGEDNPDPVAGMGPWVTVDLGTFQISETALGERPASGEIFSESLRASDTYDHPAMGLELGSEDGSLDSVHLTIGRFQGRFLLDGDPLELGSDTTETAITERFGVPYWTDRSDGETIMFYEYADGTIELQFEFSDAAALAFVTFSRNGVLSESDQRQAYGIDKPWPPPASGDR